MTALKASLAANTLNLQSGIVRDKKDGYEISDIDKLLVLDSLLAYKSIAHVKERITKGPSDAEFLRDGPNLYGFVKNNGINYYDLLGLKICFKKQNKNVSDADLEAAKKSWEEIKNSKNPDGTPTEVSKIANELENNKFDNAILVGPDGNRAAPANNNWNDVLNGKGSDADIKFNPNKKGQFLDKTKRDPTSSLAHEASHASRINTGKIPTKGGRIDRKTEEITASEHENQFRKSKNLPQRKTYGSSWKLKQY